MKTLKFNSTSWHCQIAEFGGFYATSNVDLCHYVGAFIAGVIKAICLLALFGGMAYLPVDLIIGTVFSLVYWEMLLSPMAMGLLFVIGIGLFAATLYFTTGLIVKYFINRSFELDKPDGFIKNAYLGWKNKYCVRIEIIHTK